MLEWTGERFLPWMDNAHVHYEHLHRYAFAAQLVKGKKVLDLACGEGYGTYMLAKEAEYVVGVEIDEQTVHHASSRYLRGNLKFVQGSILDVPIEGEKKFDVAVCFEAIEHVQDHDKLLLEVRRLLKNGGLFIVSTPNKANYPSGPLHNPFHIKELYFDEFRQLLSHYFKNVRFLGQKVYAGSSIWDLSSQKYLIYKEFVIDRSGEEFSFTHTGRKLPVYFIALASDTELKSYLSNVSSCLVDASDSFIKECQNAIKEKDSQIERLERDITELRQVEVSLRDTIKEKDSQIERLETTLSSIYRSRSWALLSASRNLVDRLLPPEAGRRRIAGLIFNKVWDLLLVSRVKPKKGGRSLYTRASNLTSKTFDYYRKHGLWKTVSRIYIELTRKNATNNIIRLCSPEFYAPLTSKTAINKVKRVSFLIGCLEGESKRYRVYNIVEGLKNKGIECCVFYEINLDKLEQVMDCDLLILFRAVMSPNLDTVVKRFRELDIPVIFDVDDLVVEPESVCYVHEIKSWPESLKDEYVSGVRRYRQTLERCDFATCTTEFLANRIRAMGKRCFVIPNTINRAQYELAEAICRNPSKRDKKIKIAYLSGTSTHDRDFLEAAEALGEILQRYKNTELHIVGPLALPEELKRFGHRIIRKPFMPHLEMLKYLSQMDINIAPLEQDNPFTAGKSELKIFEPALMRVPTIASRVDSYSKCISDGENGFLAGSKKEWIEKLSFLIEDEELRTNMGTNARHDFVDRFYIENVIDDVLRVYEEIVDTYHQKSIDFNHIDIAWVIPEPFAGSGGHRNIFRAVKKLSEYGHKLTMYFTGDANIETIKHIVNSDFYDLRHVKFIKYDGNFNHHDVCFATHWTTVYPIMQHKDKIKHPFYFVQDYEPMFACMGSEYILAENTYKMGLTHITSGPWPARILKNKFNVEADFFRFPVDKTVYNTNIKRTKTKKNIIFFARPEMPRRCYELGIMALKVVKERLPDVEIILFGSDKIDSKSVPFEHTNLGLVRDLNDLAKLYRNADLGIAFSTTNPSLVPYEMMACGLSVADIRLEDSVVNYGSEDNVYLLNPVPEVMAQEIVEIMNDDEGRQKKALNGYNFVQTFPDEDGMVRRIEELIKNKIGNALKQLS